MDFFSVNEVVNRRYRKGLKTLIGIICFLDILVIVVESLENGSVGTTFIVPLIILIPAFLKIGERKYTADILCNISETIQYFNLMMSNVVIDKKEVLSRSYLIEKKDLCVFINQEIGKIALVGNGCVKLINQNGQTVFEQSFSGQTIELTVKKTTFEELSNFLSTYIRK